MFTLVGWLMMLFVVPVNPESPEDGHIRWDYSVTKKSKSEYELVFTASIDRGWHLYSQSIDEGGPMPTSFRFDNNEAIKLVGKVKEAGRPINFYDSTFVMNVRWYESEVRFIQKMVVRTETQVAGEIIYSVCSEERCIPGSLRFSVDIGL